jgi:hypothetical protein
MAFIVAVFPGLSITTSDFIKVGEGKNSCLLFVCNARLIFMELLMEQHLWWNFIRKSKGSLCFGDLSKLKMN